MSAAVRATPVLDHLGLPCEFHEALSRYADSEAVDAELISARGFSAADLKRVLSLGLNRLLDRTDVVSNLLEVAEDLLEKSGEPDQPRAVVAAASAYAFDSANMLWRMGADIVAALERLDALATTLDARQSANSRPG